MAQQTDALIQHLDQTADSMQSMALNTLDLLIQKAQRVRAAVLVGERPPSSVGGDTGLVMTALEAQREIDAMLAAATARRAADAR